MERIVERVITIPLSKIVMPKDWNRDKLDIVSLVQSIKSVGQKVPLVVRVSEEHPGKVVLVDGRRRYAALLDVGTKDAAVAYVHEDSDVGAFLTSLTINLQRQDHNPMELARSFAYLQERGMKNVDIATACGISAGKVTQYSKLMDLPKEYQKAMKDDGLNLASARTLMRLYNDEDMKTFDKLGAKALEGEMSAKDLEDKVGIYFEKKEEKASAKSTGKDGKKDPESNKIDLIDYTAYEEKMRMVPKSKAVEYLVEMETKRARTKGATRRAYFEGAVATAKILSGIDNV